MARRVSVLVSLLTLAAALTPESIQAQHFGRNKVEYSEFRFRVVSSEHFDLYYYPQEEQAARLALPLAERWYVRFSALLEHEFESRQPLVLYASQPEFAQTNVISGLLSDGVGGVTESARRRIAMPFAPTLAETNRVLGHEIAHAFQFDIGRRHGGAWGLPLWFVEGMAEYLARGAIDDEARVWLRDAARTERLPRRERDAAREFSPYQYGHAFWSFLAGRYGDGVMARALKPGKQRRMQERFTYATGATLDELYEHFRRTVIQTFDAPDELRPRGAAIPAAGRMQLGPSISPDGRYAVFFSERDRLALDLFLAEVATKRVIRKLATTTASARFESLQSIRSAGAWSPDGRLFAFPATRNGHAVLMVLDVQHGSADREIPFPALGQILALSWSPEGKRLALSAQRGGFTDLYRFDLADGPLQRLTDDPFADLQPAWSPDGRTIAFVTERMTSDLAALRFGPLQLASIDVGSAVVSPLAPGAGVSQTNPQWRRDGRLFFVANHGGTRDVFTLDPLDATLRQLTHVAAGVTGLTPTSAALSVASAADVLAYTEYVRGRPQLRVLNDVARRVEAAAPMAFDTGSPDPAASTLTSEHTNPQATLTSRAYAPRLSLERIGQPYLSTGGGAFGSFVRGGGGFLFGDLLGQRRLAAAVQVGNRLRDAAFEVRYLNQERRWNWGTVVELEPGIRRYRRNGAGEHGGQPVMVQEIEDQQRVRLAARGLLAYPFSQGLRVELSAGVQHSSYRRDLRVQVESAATGRVLADTHETLSGGAPTTLAEVGVALVGDTTVFGATAPLLGSRFRFELTPAVGNLAYVRTLVDYRRYIMPVKPVSLAVRLLHSGRYGRDGDDPRLVSTFLGSRYLVRGHGLNSRHCVPDRQRICGDELLGNRVAVANLELRVPLWGLVTRQLEYGPLPADVFAFADAGMVQSAFRSYSGRWSTVSSIGGGIRINAGGLPFELLAVRALDGPARGWTVDYGFRVGF